MTEKDREVAFFSKGEKRALKIAVEWLLSNEEDLKKLIEGAPQLTSADWIDLKGVLGRVMDKWEV